MAVNWDDLKEIMKPSLKKKIKRTEESSYLMSSKFYTCRVMYVHACTIYKDVICIV